MCYPIFPPGVFWGEGPAEFSKRDNGATFRMRLKREMKDWPLTGENTLQLAGDGSGFLYRSVE